MRLAWALHRTNSALHLARQTHRGAQIHQRLGVARHVGASRRQQVLRQGPQGALVLGHRQVIAKAQHPREQALDVAIQNRRPLLKAKRRDRSRGRAANAGQGLQVLCAARKRAAKLRHHRLRALVQVARTAVVTQATPQGQHLVLIGRRQGRHVGKARQKAGKVLQHRAHLRLLQHDLGQPNAVGVLRVLPRQALPPMLALPVHQALRKRVWQSGHGFWHVGQ